MRKLLMATLIMTPVVALAAAPQTITLDVQNMICALCAYSDQLGHPF